MRDSRIPFGETSAAQNGTVIKTCQHCGAVNGDPSGICSFCDAPLGAPEQPSLSRRITAPTEGNLAIEPEWRREVSSRVQQYRARRRGGPALDLQTVLPFDSDTPGAADYPVTGTNDATPASSRQSPAPRRVRSERFEIEIPQLEIALASSHAHWAGDTVPAAGLSHEPMYSVASLAERRKAALVDAALLLFSYGGMLALFVVLGGHIGFNKLDAAVVTATFALFYAQYFALFTIFGGSTPGMMLCGLRVVTFDGGIPTSRQMAWRSFGYLISAGTFFLGFAWALWDDDQLCWQDRISRTYLTSNEEITPR
jgi:uncharacterized RDD family membrane protein YckC